MLRIITFLSAALLLSACGGESSEPAAPDAPATMTAPATEAEAKEAPKAEPEATQPSQDGWIGYGESISDQDAIAASKVLSSPDEYLGKTVKVEGEVSEVCKSMGCWLTFQHEGQELTVNMKDHAFSVDKGSKGYWCEAEGEVVKQGELLSLTAHAVRMKKAEAGEADAPEAEGAEGEADKG